MLIYDGTHWVNRPRSSIVPNLSEYATRTWVQQQGYATSAALTAHAGNTTLHVTSSERTLWNKTAADLSTILGADSDDIINKWEEVVAFLDTYTEADTLANLLSNKVDKVAGYGLSKNDFTDALLSKLNGIDAGANRYIHPTGGADASIDDAAGRVLSGITVNAQGHVTSVSSKTLAAADIPTLAISKVSGLQDALDGKLDAATFDDLFEKVNIGTTSAPKYAIRAKYGLYSDSFVSALGVNPGTGGGGGGGSYDRLDAWDEYTSERAGWVLSAALGYDLHSRVRSLEGGSALSFTTEGTGNVVTAVKKSGTAVIVTKGLTALTSHQPIYALSFQAGAFEAKKYTPNTGVATVNVPTKTSHLSNDSGFLTSAALTGYATQSWVKGLGYITASALTPYITEATAEATFATKLGVSGTQIGTYVGGTLGNLITVPYATNAASLATARTLWGQTFDGTGNVSGDMTGVGVIRARTAFHLSNTDSTYRWTASINGNDAVARLYMYNDTDSKYGDLYLGNTSSAAICIKGGTTVGIGTASPAYKLDVAGISRFSSGLIVPYTGGAWIDMATRTNLIRSETNNSASQAHALYRVKDSGGNAVVFGGLGGDVGFYGFSAANISAGTNLRSWWTIWNGSTGILTHNKDLEVLGTIHSATGIYSDGYMSAKGINTASDMRLKRRIADVALTVKDVAEAPVYRFAWINGGGIDVGSTAQYWAARVPELTHRLPDGIHLGLDYGKAALLSVVAVARATADHERRIADIERQLQNRTI